MKMFSALVLCLLATGAVSDRINARVTPVTRVVTLLKDLQKKINLDNKNEQLSYDKYACWCEKITEKKAKAIETAQDELRALTQTMLKTKGQIATLTSEIAELADRIRRNKEAQAEATALRQKQNSEYMAATTEMKQALAALEKAVLVLKEGTKMGSAFLQQGAGAAAVKTVISALPASVNLKPDQLSLLSSFAGASSGAKYAPQSWTVQGILRDMYETFAKDLEGATLDEATANRNYELFMHEKYNQIKADEAEKAKKEEQKADAEALLADTQQTFDDTDAQMKADIQFFDETKAACQAKHDDWTNRGELRTEELDGIQKAIDILSGFGLDAEVQDKLNNDIQNEDDARELFNRAIKEGKEVKTEKKYADKTGVDIMPAFFQTSSDDSVAAPLVKAYDALKQNAAKSNSLRLAALAVRVHEAKAGHFDEVIGAINDMIKTLADEDAADIAKRDQCKAEYQSISSRVANITWLIEVNEATIDKLTRTIDKLDAQRLVTIQQTEDVRQFMADITKQREDENAEFHVNKKDDQDAITLLVAAREALLAYYNNRSIEMGPIQAGVKDLSGTAFAQQGPEFDIADTQAPDTEFSHKGHRSKEAKSIVSIMTMIIEDVNDEIMNGMRDEEAAQVFYEKQMAAAKKLEADLVEKRINLEKMIATRTQERDDETVLMNNNKIDLQTEVDYKAKITPDCDWVISAFSKRANARVAEHEGLVAAKEYLVGYQASSETSLLEKGKKSNFDDAALSKIGFLGLRA